MSSSGRRLIATSARSSTSPPDTRSACSITDRKDETILLWSGRLLFERQEGGRVHRWEMRPGERVHVTPGTVHRMTAIEDADVIEVSTPELDDVVRLEDRYGREGTTRA